VTWKKTLIVMVTVILIVVVVWTVLSVLLSLGAEIEME
jgi:hypothetical protein